MSLLGHRRPENEPPSGQARAARPAAVLEISGLTRVFHHTIEQQVLRRDDLSLSKASFMSPGSVSPARAADGFAKNQSRVDGEKLVVLEPGDVVVPVLERPPLEAPR